MAQRVLLLGKKTNPYPYMKHCDLYAQPSRYEGKALTVREAQMLGKAVLVAAFQTAHSQVRDGVDALIAGTDAVTIADGLERLITNPALKMSLEQGAAQADYSCEPQLKALYALLEG